MKEDGMWRLWGRTECGACGEEQKCMQGLVGKPEGKRPLGRGRREYEDNTKMGETEIGRDGMD
jgi:hypothetical protein